MTTLRWALEQSLVARKGFKDVIRRYRGQLPRDVIEGVLREVHIRKLAWARRPAPVIGERVVVEGVEVRLRGEGKHRGPVDASVLLHRGVSLRSSAQGQRSLSEGGVKVLQRWLEALAGVGVEVAVGAGALGPVGVDGVVEVVGVV